jgi:hypothetical protein
MRKLVVVDKNKWIAMCVSYEQDMAYYRSLGYAEETHAYCKCGNYIDFEVVRSHKCMPCIYRVRRVVVSVLLGLFVFGVALLGGHLLHS